MSRLRWKFHLSLLDLQNTLYIFIALLYRMESEHSIHYRLYYA